MTAATLPLEGLRVVVTRPRVQADELADRLEILGAEPVMMATIAIEPPSDGGAALRAALAGGEYDQVVVASPNGARAVLASLPAQTAILPPVACVGPSTARVFDPSPMVVNVVPDRAVAEGLVEALPLPDPGADRLLLAQAEVARDVLERGMADKGWQIDRVTAYRTVDGVISDDDRAAASTADVVLFTSSSTVERFVRLVGLEALPPTVASIGPITSTTARDHGIDVAIEADPHTLDGLVDAVVDWAVGRAGAGP